MRNLANSRRGEPVRSLLTIMLPVLPVLAAFGAADASAQNYDRGPGNREDWVCAKVTFRTNYFAGTGLREAEPDSPAWVNLNRGIGYVLVRDDPVKGNRMWEGFYLAANVQMKVPDPNLHANRICPALDYSFGGYTLCHYGDADQGAREDQNADDAC